jgi:glycosyltransferase involved in cell wall biosynthesis
MKIVFVLHFRLDRNAGAAGVLFALTDQFRAAGHQVSAISHDGLGRLPLIVRNLIFPFYSAAKLALHHADADVIEGATGDCWLYYLARMRNRTTLYVTFSHGLYRPLHDRLMREKAAGRAKISWKYRLFHGSLELWQEAFSMRMADLVYVLNADEKRFATERLRIDPARISIVKNGLGEQFRRRAANVRSALPRQKRLGIVQVGSYEERKGIKVSVAATTRLLEANPELHMAFFGTVRPAEQTLGDYPDHLRSRVTVLPRFDNARLPDLLADYDIFIMPSTYEGFGIAPLEAMACGLVPIVTNIAGPAEYMVDGWNGLVIPVDSADALEAALSRLIGDTELYARLRAGALDTVEKFGWADVAQARLRDYALYGSRKKGHAVEDVQYAKSVEL